MTRRPPLALVVLAGVAVLFVLLPFIGLVGRAPWSRFGAVVTSGLAVDAIRLSLVSSLMASALALILGLPLAWVLARVDFRGKNVLRALVLLPLVLPPVVGGTALLLAFGRRGLAGSPLEAASGFVLPFSIWGVVLAATFVAMPFLVITVEGALRNLDNRYEGMAATLGADRWTVMRRVTLPMIGPSLVAGLVLTWARALGEFGATITFAGNVQGRTQTLPLAIFFALESDREAAVILSLVMVAISLVVLIALRRRWVSAL